MTVRVQVNVAVIRQHSSITQFTMLAKPNQRKHMITNRQRFDSLFSIPVRETRPRRNKFQQQPLAMVVSKQLPKRLKWWKHRVRLKGCRGRLFTQSFSCVMAEWTTKEVIIGICWGCHIWRPVKIVSMSPPRKFSYPDLSHVLPRHLSQTEKTLMGSYY
jgi:hypothetical protein